MRWQVLGRDRETGLECVEFVEARSSANAAVVARLNGLEVIEVIGEPPPLPAPRPAAMPPMLPPRPARPPVPPHKRLVIVGAWMWLAGVVIAIVGAPLIFVLIGFPIIILGGALAGAGILTAIVGGILWLQASA